ncbi:N-acetylmuramidase family protein [Dyella acidisoli]|uniref:Bacteriophage-acquired protein n=1 Tax=Dyella acidisoli TaxID=1867834 RepID=A0ABQ5XSN5_9GAMM|nr:N-acetylmuramidase family protein [Dyella acidisoli]GLQ93463.1 bacteriophage-acquired protein [Dyella acidisoli]
MTTNFTLRTGDHGADVTVLQQRLHRVGHPVVIDGWYGPTTEAAVRAFQRSRHLIEDGIAGPRTQSALLGTVDPRALTQADIERAAAELGCEGAAINAVVEVESPRTGYLPDGRVVILFERHVFWRQLQAHGIDPTTVQAPVSILSQARGGYVGGVAEYARLAQAAAIAQEPAMEACSWGRFQIMGHHARALRYASATAMAAAFAAGEAEQLQAFVRFVENDAELFKALRNRKWAAFARSYNGPGYADNLYDVKLAKAYARHAAARPSVSEMA